MAEFLLELRSEEIPARMQAKAAADLKRLATDKLTRASLDHSEAHAYVTPRRLALVVDGLPEKQPDTTQETRGPKVGAPDKAVQGFLRSNGLASEAEAEIRETEKGRFYYAVKHIEGRATATVLGEIVAEVARELPWPKSMRWATSRFRYVRPLHDVLAVFDGATIPGYLDLDGDSLVFGNQTRGHPFLAPDPVEVHDFADYRDKLENRYVVLDQDARKQRIHEHAAAKAEAAGLRLKDDPALLEENAGMVEWPVVLMGTIPERFMALPPEVLTTSMRSHQKYFATETPDGDLGDRFIVVANIETPDNGAAVVAGNERVLRARLSDAEFFWDTDRQTPLADRLSALDGMVFHARLGSMRDKVERIQALAVSIGDRIAGADRDKARSAAYLAKADLTTGMVDEFPELQGIMGWYYARHDGESREVADAIAAHYSPLGPSEPCPHRPVSTAVALADKIDTLVGFFAIGETPTGSKDPFALRRAALGVIRLIVENDLRLPLATVIGEALRLQGTDAQQALHDRAGGQAPADVLAGELLGFLADRLKVVLRDRGVRHDLIAAVFAVERPEGGPEDDLTRLLARVEALRAFLQSDDGANLLAAYRRATNIVRIESRKDKTAYSGEVDPTRLTEDAETALFDALTHAEATATDAVRREHFTDAMAAMAALRQPVDRFFDTVTVNAEDPEQRRNRLNLLARIGHTLARVADFAQIEG